jgi:2-aminoadipate transaminase
LDLVRRYSRQHRIIILEDAAYRELRFAGADIPSIKGLDTDNQYVAYTATFSKPCAPGLRTGYGLLPPDLMAAVLRFKGNHDFGSGNFNQYVIDRLMETGAYGRHVTEVQEAYRVKSRATTDALAAEFREWPGVTWTKPTGGMYVWVTFPPHVPTGPDSPLMQACLREGVLYVPGEFCHVAAEGQPLPRNELRLCYGVVTVEQVREGVHRLARAAKGVLGGVVERDKPRTAAV